MPSPTQPSRGGASPRLCAAALHIEDGAVVEVGQRGDGDDHRLSVVGHLGDERVSRQVEALEVGKGAKQVDDRRVVQLVALQVDRLQRQAAGQRRQGLGTPQTLAVPE